MSDSESLYTYRGGQKLPLTKKPDQFVVRALPVRLLAEGLTDVVDAEQVSSASTRVETRPGELEAMMERSREIAPTHHAYTIGDSGQEFLVTDRVMVSFKEPLGPEKLGAFAGKYGLRQLEAYSNRDYLFELTNHTGINPVKLVVKLTEEEKDLVAVAENDLNYRIKKKALALPTDPDYARQWHLHAFTHSDVDPRAHARCEAAWQQIDSFGSRDVVVGVTDDGCKTDHPDFDSPDKFMGWAYFQGSQLIKRGDIGAQPSGMYVAGNDHGTSCNGVIAGEVDAVLTVGAASGCRLWPVLWETTPSGGLAISDSKMMTMLGHLGDKVEVLSNSWGGVPINTWGLVVVNRIRQLAVNGGRRGRGIVFLWAAGNENCPIQHETAQPVPFTWGWERISGAWQWVGVETATSFQNNLVGIPGVMHVAALASTAQRSHYSNYGTGISLCAPSSNIHEYQRLPVRGLGITTATGEAGGVTDDFGGTSSATPLTAGIAALVISANPALTALEVVSILKSTASKDLNMQAYPRTPPASYDLNPSWDVSPVAPFNSGAFQNIGGTDGTWSPWFGHGRVDADAAVAEAIRRRTGVVGQTIRQAAAPALAIPDNQAAGVSHVLAVPQAGRIKRLTVSVDIEHTWISDLRVSLTTPGGKTVVLHDRKGGSQRNLVASYRSEDVLALAGLLGDPAQGNWTLRVADVAGGDVGILRSWSLEFELEAAAEAVQGEAVPALFIPDNTPAGVSSGIAIAQAGTVRGIKVSVDITHSWIGDLRVEIVAPSGQSAVLHDQSGRDEDNIIRSYDSVTSPALAALVGQASQGNWQLRVKDLAADDIGKLNRWKLELML